MENIQFETFKTIEELKEYINKLKKYPISNAIIRGTWGSFEKFEKTAINQWINLNKRSIQDQTELTIYSTKAMQKYIDNKINPRNNIGKKCKVQGHPYLKDNTEGIIKDIVELTQQYVVIVNNDILYIKFENVIVIESEEWKDIITQGYDKDEKANYKITMTKENIKIETWCDDMFQEKNNTYILDNLGGIQDILINNIKKKKDIVINYILTETKTRNVKKDFEEILDKIEELKNKEEILKDKYEEYVNQTDFLLERLVN